MSFLGFESFLVPLGASITDVVTLMKTAITSYGWQVVRDGSLNPIQEIIGTLGDASYPLKNAYADQVRSSSSATAAALPVYTGVRMAAPKTVGKIHITASGSQVSAPGGFQNDAIKRFILEYSDDGAAWTSTQEWGDLTNWVERGTRTFDVTTNPGAHPYWRLKVTEKNGTGYVAVSRIIFEDENGNPFVPGAGVNPWFEIIPPATETIGDATSRGVVRVGVTGTTITFYPVLQSIGGAPQVVKIWEKTAGAVAAAVTIGGATATGATGTSASTAKGNLRALYDAIQQSTDANFTSWTWLYQTPAAQNANSTEDEIIGIRKTVGDALGIVANANVNACNIGAPFPAGAPAFHYRGERTITIDLINGFIYYLQVDSRHIGLATKTNVGFYGPIHAAYGDHDKAIQAMPQGHAPLTSVVELIVGSDEAANNLGSVAFPTHWWGIYYVSNGPGAPWEEYVSSHPFNSCRIRHMAVDYLTMGAAITGNFIMTLRGSNLFTGDPAIGNDFQIHRQGLVGTSIFGEGGGNLQFCFAPQLDIEGWYKFRGTAVNEALVLIADTIAFSESVNGMAAGDTPTQIVLANTSGFQPSGYIVWGTEIFQYTGNNKTTNTLSGITRAKYGTTAVAHYLGEQVNQGEWLVVINGGALFCGYNKPS